MAEFCYAYYDSGTWVAWTNGTANTIPITATNGYTQVVWGTWTADSGTSSISVVPGTTTWRVWTTGSGSTLNVFPKPKELTEEEKRQRAQQLERQRLEAERQRAERVAAEARSMELLQEFLDAMQRDQLAKEKAFIVVSETGKRFKIEPGYHKGATELDENGQPLGYHCIFAPDVPGGDEALAKKLMLEHDEAQFRRIANFTPARV